MNKKKTNQNFSYPLSYAQRRIWFLSHLEGSALSYNIGSITVIPEALDEAVLQSVLDELVEKNEILRSNFVLAEDGEPRQVVKKKIENNLVICDLRKSPNKLKEKNKIIKENREYNFDLKKDSLVRVCLVRLTEKRYYFLVTMHHLVSDIWSLAIFGNSFFNLYNQRKNNFAKFAFSESKESLQYKDYAVWERSREFRNRLEKQEKYWLEKLSGDLIVIDLPTDRPRPLEQTYKTGLINIEIDSELAKKINSFCQANNVTSYVFLLACFNILLAKLSNQTDIIVGTYSANRDLPELDSTIGVFLNNLAIRSKLDFRKKFDSYLEEMQENVLTAMENKEYPFELLIERLNQPRDLSRSPIFSNVFQMFSYDDRLRMNFYRVEKAKELVFDNGMSQFDLTMKAFASERKIQIILNHNSFLFKRETAKKFLQWYLSIIRKVITNSQIKIGEISILSQAEQQKILKKSLGEIVKIPENQSVFDMFNRQAEEVPNKIALTYSGKNYKYHELRERVDKASSYLVTKGVRRGKVVGIMMNRTENLIILILSLLKIGAAYVPLSKEIPKERINFILTDSRAEFLISDIPNLSFEKVLKIIYDDNIFSDAKNRKITSLAGPEDLAYVMYTSGSTGLPKGVRVKHSSLVNFIFAAKKALKISENTRFLASTNFSFDIFFLETIVPLCSGASLVLAGDSERQSVSALQSIVQSFQVNTIQFTPSFAELMLNHDKSQKWLSGVDKFILGGENLSGKLFEKLRNNFLGDIFNLYGPTEATIWTTATSLRGEKKVNIGKPLANTRVYVLDRVSNLCPDGVSGEICIAGRCLAESYTSETETKKVFLPDPFFPEALMYRTGDFGKRLVDGKIEYLGRSDEQVKIFGRRIEVSEIELLINNYPEVRGCVVIPRYLQDKTVGLCAYLVGSKALDIESLRRYLEKCLPYYLVPSHLSVLDALPLTINGKIDRKKISKIEPTKLSADYQTGFHNNTEKLIAEIWRRVLKIKTISPNDDFFRLGGHSLKLMEVFNELEKIFPGKFNLAQLFSRPTIARLAEVITMDFPQKEREINYRRRAERLIDQVRQGRISVNRAAKIFDKL